MSILDLDTYLWREIFLHTGFCEVWPQLRLTCKAWQQMVEDPEVYTRYWKKIPLPESLQSMIKDLSYFELMSFNSLLFRKVPEINDGTISLECAGRDRSWINKRLAKLYLIIGQFADKINPRHEWIDYDPANINEPSRFNKLKAEMESLPQTWYCMLVASVAKTYEVYDFSSEASTKGLVAHNIVFTNQAGWCTLKAFRGAQCIEYESGWSYATNFEICDSDEAGDTDYCGVRSTNFWYLELPPDQMCTKLVPPLKDICVIKSEVDLKEHLAALS